MKKNKIILFMKSNVIKLNQCSRFILCDKNYFHTVLEKKSKDGFIIFGYMVSLILYTNL